MTFLITKILYGKSFLQFCTSAILQITATEIKSNL